MFAVYWSFCPSVCLIKCTSSTDIAVYHTNIQLQSSVQHFPNSEDVSKFVCNSNWCVNYQWVRPWINDQLRPQTKDQSRTAISQFLSNLINLANLSKCLLVFKSEWCSCYLEDFIFLIKIALESQGAIYWRSAV